MLGYCELLCIMVYSLQDRRIENVGYYDSG